MAEKKILVVGAVAGGASAAARLRRLDENCEIIMFEKGEHISFANCGLPYYIGGKICEKSALILRTPKSFGDRFIADVRVFSEVTAIDRAAKSVKVRNTQSGEMYEESYDKLILSMGAEPIRFPVEGASSERVFTLRNVPDTYNIKEFIEQRKPRTAAIVGGGYIGVEMAENLHNAGVSVTLIEMQDALIPTLDFDLACDVHSHMKSKGVNLMLGTAVSSIRETSDGLSIALDGGEIQADMLILAIGVRPETSIAKDAGIATNERGAIITDSGMRTSDPDIYAVGDAVEVTDFVTGQKTMIPLAGPAIKQGRIAAENVCGGNRVYNGTQGSAILKVFDMTVASTGINEKTAKRLSLNYEKVFTYPTNHPGYYPGTSSMSIKTIFEKDSGKILGAQIVGFEGSDKRCDVFATAIRLGASAKDLAELELCYAPPFSSAKDPVNMVGFAIENLLDGKTKIFHWHDIKDLPCNGSVNKVDVRTPAEYEKAHIEGFINMPLNDIRQRMNELDKKKPLYINCQVGVRGYIACRIFAQHGFDCYNLSGGFRLYSSIM